MVMECAAWLRIRVCHRRDGQYICKKTLQNTSVYSVVILAFSIYLVFRWRPCLVQSLQIRVVEETSEV